MAIDDQEAVNGGPEAGVPGETRVVLWRRRGRFEGWLPGLQAGAFELKVLSGVAREGGLTAVFWYLAWRSFRVWQGR